MMIDLVKEDLVRRVNTVLPALYGHDAYAQKAATMVADTALERIERLIEPTVKNIAAQLQGRPDISSSLTISFLFTLITDLQSVEDQEDILNRTIAEMAMDDSYESMGEVDVEPLKKIIQDEVSTLQESINRFHSVHKMQHEAPPSLTL